METRGIITIIGLGPGAAEHLSRGALELLRQSRQVFLRTKIHPVVELLQKEGIVFSTFDYLYEQTPSFPEVYGGICRELLKAARQSPVLYAVPGHPLVHEESVRLLLEEAPKEGIEVLIHPALSFLDVILSSLKINTDPALQVLDGLSLETCAPATSCPVIVTQVYSKLVAADVKITLLDYYPPEHQVTVVQAAGVPGLEKIERLPLWKMDRLDWYDHLTSLYLPPGEPAGENAPLEKDVAPEGNGLPLPTAVAPSANLYPLDRLAYLMTRLRGSDGCPWDREQDHLTLRTYLLEETYEVLEALHENNPSKICEELGDLLLQIVFHSQIAAENEKFDLNDVIRGIGDKIVRRHPHVFGTVTVKDSREVNLNWEKIKAEEKGDAAPQRILASLSRNLPALMWAAKLQKKAAVVGFDWPDYSGPLEKVLEEAGELKEALLVGEEGQIEAETGDLLFSVVNLARKIRVDPEIALIRTCEKFVNRFNYVEDKATKDGGKMTDFSLDQLDIWWEEAKSLENNKKFKESSP